MSVKLPAISISAGLLQPDRSTQRAVLRTASQVMGPHRNPNAIDECLSFSNHEARIVVEIESNRFIGQAARVKIRAELGVKVEPTPSWNHTGRD